MRAYQALEGGAAEPVSIPTLLLLHAASFCLYGAGMTLNDVFDRGRDRALYPGRPIPSGQVGARAAAIQGGLLLALGVGLSFLAGLGHGLVGATLAAAILLYDGLAKRWAIPGALVMGAVRYLDVQLGAGLPEAAELYWPALVLGLYVAGLTYISTLEETPEQGGVLRVVAVSVVAVVGIGGYEMPHHLWAVWPCALVAAVVVAFAQRAYRDRTKGAVKSLVLVMLLGIFAVNGGSLLGLGLWPLGLSAIALAGSFFGLKKLLAG